MVNRRHLYTALVASTLVCGACSSADDGISVSTADSAGVSLITIRGPMNRLPVFTLDTSAVAALDSPDTAGFSLVTTAGLVGPEHFVTDSRAFRIHVYDSAGRYRRSFGGEGSGPGEIRSAQTTSAVDGTVTLWDLALRRFSAFTIDSGLVRSISLPRQAASNDVPREAWGTGDGGFLVLWLRPLPAAAPSQGSIVVRREQPGGLVLYDSAGIEKARSPSFTAWVSGQTELGELRLPIASSPFVAISEDRIAYGSGETFTISITSPELQPTAQVRWEGLDSAVTDAEIDDARATRRAAMPPGANAEMIDATLRLMFDPSAIPARRPAISRALWEETGALWLGLFHPPSRNAPEAYDWVVLSADLRPVGMLRLPRTVRLEAVRDDAALVTVQDEFGEQSVQLRRLRR